MYTYLTHDHLGTGWFGFNQSKTQVPAHEHLPYGQRYAISGTTPYHEFMGNPWNPYAQLCCFPYRYYSPAEESLRDAFVERRGTIIRAGLTLVALWRRPGMRTRRTKHMRCLVTGPIQKGLLPRLPGEWRTAWS